jgi:hypothetical protein
MRIVAGEPAKPLFNYRVSHIPQPVGLLKHEGNTIEVGCGGAIGGGQAGAVLDPVSTHTGYLGAAFVEP